MRLWISVAAMLGLSGVILGALGAHALTERLAEADRLTAWQTAVQYQMWHALALLAIGILGTIKPSGPPLLSISGVLFALGTLLFSGSIYGLALGGPGFLGPVTPLGGLALIGGWLVLLLFALRAAPQMSGHPPQMKDG